jgi:glycosyltransferase involved in cell wall biosynthesis
MIRVALIANTDWYLYNFRLSLVKALQEKDYDVILISPGGEYTSLLKEQGFKWYEWQVSRQSIVPWQELKSIRRLVHLYRQLKPDLVHHHTIKPVLYGGIAAHRAQVPAVVASITGRGYSFQGQGSRAQLLEQVVKPFYRCVLRIDNTQIIFENESDQQYFVHAGFANPEQCHLIESVGVDPELFYPVPEPDGPAVILLASRMLWDKGVGVLVEAARLLQQKGLEFKIELVGNPDPGNPTSISKKQLHAWEKENLLEWLGWQSDMQHIFAQCHIVVLPSFHEGVPTGLLEAAACGRPIVASDIPGCRTVVNDGKTGLLVPPRQPEPLAAALECLILDPDLRGRMGKAGRERILRHFTQQQINKKTLEVYRLALSRQV